MNREPHIIPKKYGKTGLSLIRGAGALCLFAALGSFLFREWEAIGSLTLFWQLLAASFGLSVSGLVVARLLDSATSARVFLLSSLATTPITAAALGGLIYVSSFSNPLILLAAAVTICYWYINVRLASRMLGAAPRKKYAALFVALNALLILPFRAWPWGCAMVGIGILAFIWWSRGESKQHPAWRTGEGLLLKLAPLLSIGLIVGRSAIYHLPAGAEGYFVATLGVLSALFATWMARQRQSETNLWPIVWDLLAAPGIFVAGCALLVQWGGQMPLPAALGASALAAAGGYFALSFFANSKTTDYGYRGLAIVSVLCSVMALLIGATNGSIGYPLTTLLMSVGCIAISYEWRSRVLAFLGSATAIWSSVMLIMHMTMPTWLSGWPLLAGAGFMLIIVATLIERHGSALKHKYAGIRRHYASTSTRLTHGILTENDGAFGTKLTT